MGKTRDREPPPHRLGAPRPVIDQSITCKLGDTITLWGLYDVHTDSDLCNLTRLKEDIREILADPNAYVVIGGDFNDLMQAKGDPRYVHGQTRQQFAEMADFADAIFEDNIRLLKPLAEAGKIVAYLTGNHEQQFANRHGTDLAKRTALHLDVPFGGYCCFLRLFFRIAGKCHMLTGYLHHGYGGNPQVTGGTIQMNRDQVNVRADFFMTGHIHKKTYMGIPVQFPMGSEGNGRIRVTEIVHGIGGGYKNTLAHGKVTWEQSLGSATAPIGAAKVLFRVRNVCLPPEGVTGKAAKNFEQIFVEPRIN